MKRTLLVAALVIMATLLAMPQMSCTRMRPESDNFNDTGGVQPSPTVAQVTPSVRPTASPASDQATDLVEAESRGYIDYTVSGAGTSAEMDVSLKNKTDQLLNIAIGAGTKLSPSGGDVQRMVVTKDARVVLHPHEQTTTKLESACLDISKAPPAQKNKSWSVEKSPAIGEFISCTNNFIDEMKTEEPSGASMFERLRPTLVQFAVWQARGASRQDWIHFWVQYQNKTPDEARELVDQVQPILQEIVRRCPALPQM